MTFASVKRYVDTKIEKKLQSKDSYESIIEMLNESIGRFTKNIAERKNGKNYFLAHNEWSEKRLHDIMKIEELSKKFYGHSPISLFNLLKLREKINGENFEFKSIEDETFSKIV